MYTRRTLVSPLYVTARHGCHHQAAHTVANVNKKIDNNEAGDQQIQEAGELMNLNK